MTKEDLKEMLINNLDIRIDVGYDYNYHGRRVEVMIYFDGELISQASDSLPECDH